MSTTTPSAHEALPVLGTNIVQPELFRRNHQIHHVYQNQQHHQNMDRNITLDKDPPDTSSLVNDARKRKIEPNSFDAE